MHSLNPAVDKSIGLKRYPAEGKLHRIQSHGKSLGYDPNSMEVFELDDADEPAVSFDGPNFPLFVKQFPLQLCLNLCHDCNLACRYCFVRHQAVTKELKYMTPLILRKALDHFFDGLPKLNNRNKLKVGISFFGGEPTLPSSWELLKDGVSYAKSLAELRNVHVTFHLTTNGTLLSEEKIEYLQQHGFSMIVSLDGPEDVHNRNRPARREAFNSWQATMMSLSTLARFPVLARRTTLRGTFGIDDVQLVSRLEFLNSLVSQGMAGSVSVEPLNLSETSCHNIGEKQMIIDTSDEHREIINQEYYEASEWFLARRKSGCSPSFFHYEASMKRLARRIPQPSECGAAWGFYTVNPLGDIYPCHREGVGAIGSLEFGISEQLREPWKDNRWYCRTKCPSCPIRNFCGGGCRVVSHQITGDIHTSDGAMCMLKKVWLKECAWILSETSQEEWVNVRPRTFQGQSKEVGESKSCTRCDSSEKRAD